MNKGNAPAREMICLVELYGLVSANGFNLPVPERE
jgi:hypothetical protein